MRKNNSFFDEILTGVRRRLWVIPLWFCLTVATSCVWTIIDGGSHPVIFVLAIGFAIGAWLTPAIPTKCDLLAEWKVAVATIDKCWADRKITRDEAERLLAEASSYAHHRNVIWWPLWWLSERGKLRRLIAQQAR